jgi:hypothetical protein
MGVEKPRKWLLFNYDTGKRYKADSPGKRIKWVAVLLQMCPAQTADNWWSGCGII